MVGIGRNLIGKARIMAGIEYCDPKEPGLDYVEAPDTFWDGVGVGIIVVVVVEVALISFCHLAGCPVITLGT